MHARPEYVPMNLTNRIYTCEKVTSSDNIHDIAKYIHLTDPHIYPAICKNPCDENWIALIQQCIDQPDEIYFREHLLAVKCNNKIVGVACVIPCAKKLSFAEHSMVPEALRDNIARTKKGYFDLLVQESMEQEGYTITNLCIDKAYRNQGVGTMLLKHCIEIYDEKPMYLDVIASNDYAVRLYQNCGFVITGEYPGFSLTVDYLPCYHMVRR